jgi:hypothetical protein
MCWYHVGVWHLTCLSSEVSMLQRVSSTSNVMAVIDSWNWNYVALLLPLHILLSISVLFLVSVIKLSRAHMLGSILLCIVYTIFFSLQTHALLSSKFLLIVFTYFFKNILFLCSIMLKLSCSVDTFFYLTRHKYLISFTLNTIRLLLLHGWKASSQKD